MHNSINVNQQSFLLNKLFGKEVSILTQNTGPASKAEIKLGGLGSIKDLDKEIITKFERNTGLLFLEKMEEGNVCFANNNDDMRDEFKQVFSPADVLDYIYGAINSSDDTIGADLKDHEISFPKNSDIFWKLAGKGKLLRTS